MTGPPDFEHPEPPDGWPTIVRLPLLPSPAEMAEMRDRRQQVEAELAAQTTQALTSVAVAARNVGAWGQALDDAVAAARAAGASWTAIAEHVGISRQSATERWGAK